MISGTFVVVVLLRVVIMIMSSSLLEASIPLPPPESMVKSTCTDFKCGNFSIPYPFGMGEACYSTPWFSINCNRSFHPPKLFLNHSSLLNLELLNISVYYQTVTVNSPMSSFRSNSCTDEGGKKKNETKASNSIDLSGTPFWFSTSDNIFMVLGCGSARLLNQSKAKAVMAGCGSICPNGQADTDTKECFGVNCCQTTISSTGSGSFKKYSMDFTTEAGYNDTAGCMTHALVVDRDWFSRNFSSRAVIATGYAPSTLFWMIQKHDPYANKRCVDNIYYCDCRFGTEGNPFLKNGCRAVKECAHCSGTCDYGYNHNSKKRYYFCNTKNRVKAMILGFSISGGSLLLFLGSFVLYKVVKKKREIRRKRHFFKRNGGLLLEQQISSNNGTIEKTKIFSSKELEKATDNFNMNRILGQGGQGTVYKGMLTDGRIVAVKKSKIIDESQIEHFINEIVILSQINHRNVVGLLGCCLETEVPLLVYEFISNGNLFQLIQNQDSDFLLSWKMRLQIATEVAGALAYLHSACSIPIYHRDIKSTNILLDDKYRAKVSDFGTSRSIAIEQTHLTTIVQGTFGYLDPEYFQSSQFTDKSDVYSFGVVLTELLTGQKPICSTRSQEEKSLATHFILSLQESCLFDILDARVVKEGGKEEILALAHLAYGCLSLNGKKRPTMKEVAMELEHIKMSLSTLKVEQNFEENAYTVTEMTGPLDGGSSFASSYLDCNKTSLLDEQPFLFKTL